MSLLNHVFELENDDSLVIMPPVFVKDYIVRARLHVASGSCDFKKNLTFDYETPVGRRKLTVHPRLAFNTIRTDEQGKNVPCALIPITGKSVFETTDAVTKEPVKIDCDIDCLYFLILDHYVRIKPSDPDRYYFIDLHGHVRKASAQRNENGTLLPKPKRTQPFYFYITSKRFFAVFQYEGDTLCHEQYVFTWKVSHNPTRIELEHRFSNLDSDVFSDVTFAGSTKYFTVHDGLRFYKELQYTRDDGECVDKQIDLLYRFEPTLPAVLLEKNEAT